MDCFKLYKYWPLKTLKARVDQPEAYLKQTLEIIAQLVRQGTYAMTWQLKPDYTMDAFNPQDDRAPDTVFGADGALDAGEGGESGDEDEDLKLESVMPL